MKLALQVLMMGSVPVVLSSPLDVLYKQFPALTGLASHLCMRRVARFKAVEDIKFRLLEFARGSAVCKSMLATRFPVIILQSWQEAR